jgi:glucose/arabinose dehydrogenase
VWVAEMGGWAKDKGRLSRLSLREGAWVRETVLEPLDRPHALRLGPDGKVYVGVVGGVLRMEGRSAVWVIGGNSKVQGPTGTGMHPLTNFVFDRAGHMVVNNGSATDHCEALPAEKGKQEGKNASVAPDPRAACPETQESPPRAALLHYRMRWPEGVAAAPTVVATGLRNSMALAVHASGTLVQGENSRDAIHRADSKLDDAKLPHDELNVIAQGKHYGWPQCYDNNAVAPEYAALGAAACASRTKPVKLLTPHASPLGMAYAPTGAAVAPQAAAASAAQPLKTPMERAFSGMLIVPYHGYRAGAHRIVGFQIDAQGVPQGAAIPLVHGWEADPKAKKPMGAPTEIAFDAGGNLWVTEDRNGTLLRLVARQP